MHNKWHNYALNYIYTPCAFHVLQFGSVRLTSPFNKYKSSSTYEHK